MRYASIYKTFSSDFQCFYDRAFEERHNIIPAYFIYLALIAAFHFHELVVAVETLLIQRAAAAVVAEQTHKPAVFRHHYEHIPPARLTVELLPDDGAHAVVLAAHVMEIPEEIEFIETGNVYHSAERFVTSLLSWSSVTFS